MVISELARKRLDGDRLARHSFRHFPVVDVPADAEALTVQCVEAIVDDEGLPALLMC